MNEDKMIDNKLKAALIAEFNAIPPIEELEKMYTFSERHNKKMEKLFAKVRRRERFERYFAALKKIAVIALIAVGFAVVALKVVPTVYAYVEAWITENADDRLIFKDKNTKEDSGGKEELRFELGYVPEGYELVGEEFSKIGNGKVTYKNQEGQLLQLKWKSNGNQISINTEGVMVEENIIEGIQYYVFEGDNRQTVVIWKREGQLFSLTGIFKKEEMLDIVFSMRIVENK